MSHRFSEGEKVLIYHLGDGKEYAAIICGIEVDLGINPATIWIVEPCTNAAKKHFCKEYSHFTVPESCLKEL
ncbi:Uncharacterised protein [uncultured archaeon]|nr:Uncharacterised protein [uncultured archaeon]